MPKRKIVFDYETWTTGRLRVERDKAMDEADYLESWAGILDYEIKKRFAAKANHVQCNAQSLTSCQCGALQKIYGKR